MRIQLKTGLAVLRRGPSTVQIGLDQRHGTVLDGLDDGDVQVLHELMGGLDDSLLSGPLPAGAAEAGRAQRARRIVAALAGTGVLLRSRSGRSTLGRVGDLRPRLAPDAAALSLTYPLAGDGWGLLAARRGRVVEIQGTGRTGSALATALAAAGIGLVTVSDPAPVSASDLVPGGATPHDIGFPGETVARRALGHALGRIDPDPPPAPVMVGRPRAGQGTRQGTGAPDLVVLIDRSVADATRADPLVPADIPHLSIVIRETSVVVGPLVLPGRGPCLRCLDLHRSDGDRAWPLLLAQLLGQACRRRAPREETALAQLAAALATLQILAHLDGQTVPATTGATLEAELPDGLISCRPWPVHPGCGCHWPPTGPGPCAAPPGCGEPPPQGKRTEPGTDRMPP